MLDYKRFLFSLNNSKSVFTDKKLHEKNNTTIILKAFLNQQDLKPQFKRFNNWSPNLLNRVHFIFAWKTKCFFFCRTVRVSFFFFVRMKSRQLLMPQYNLQSKIFRGKAKSRYLVLNWEGDLSDTIRLHGINNSGSHNYHQ